MTEITDAPLMPKDKHCKRKKRLAGYNRFGEKQPDWRDVWVISVYDAEELVAYQPKPKNATQSVEAIVEILHRRLSDSRTESSIRWGHDGPEFRDLFINLLEKMDENEEGEKNYWLYLNLAKTLEEGDSVQIKGEPWDAKRLRARAVQLFPKVAYWELMQDMIRFDNATVNIGQETLTQDEVIVKAIGTLPTHHPLFQKFHGAPSG
eukprot:Skav227983  [mRNA]  locus=scaffold1165:347545:348285:+ [translate_table: standard]